MWHFQATPGDQWDYTSTQHIVLADIAIGGKPRKILMQAPKNGFFYVIDRTNGRLISADPYVPVNWASGIDPITGRPRVNPEAYYNKTGRPWLAAPGFLGGHNWHPMAYSRQTGLVYVPVQEIGTPYIPDTSFTWRKQSVNLGVDLEKMGLPADRAIIRQVKAGLKGRIVAWDPISRKPRWTVELGGPWNGGMLATAGNLLFQGTAAGEFRAYDARSGRKLWTFQAQSGIVAPPVTYSVNGRQYVTVVAGWGGVYPLLLGELARGANDRTNNSRVLTFALDGKAVLPTQDARMTPAAPPPPFGTEGQIAQGRTIYARTCSGCHGDGVMSGGVIPDLRYSVAAGDRNLWLSVTWDGILAERGMVSFRQELDRAQLEAVRAYVVARASEDWNTRDE